MTLKTVFPLNISSSVIEHPAYVEAQKKQTNAKNMIEINENPALRSIVASFPPGVIFEFAPQGFAKIEIFVQLYNQF